jgi:hypothetical protein
MPKSSSFSTRSTRLRNELRNECGISVAFDPASPPAAPDIRKFSAIWDTGATNSVIMQRVVDALGLVPIGMADVGGMHGVGRCEVYLVNIYLPNGVSFAGVQVTKGGIASCDMLVGMDIIATGDFAVTNFDGKTIFCFRHPSLAAIDFVAEHQAALQKEQMLAQAQARRQPSQKFKHREQKKKRK